MVLKVLLDSTYMLPSFGIAVEGLSDEHLSGLRDAWLGGLVRFYCLSASWVEVIGKVCREARKLNVEIDGIVDAAVKSLSRVDAYEWTDPPPEAIKLAFKLRMAGHKDVIDNLLYATSVARNMILLTMDEQLKDFLARRGFKTENVIDHEQLLRRVRM